MLRQNEWYASFTDWTCIYQVSIKIKYPALVYHVVRTNEEKEDFPKKDVYLNVNKYLRTGKEFLFVY